MSFASSYQNQQFFNWLQEHQVQIDDIASIQHEQLLYWAKQFLSEQWDRNFFKEDKDNLLIFILQIENFLNYLNKKELSREIDNFFADRESKLNRFLFRVFIDNLGSQIFEEFSQYIESVDRQLDESANRLVITCKEPEKANVQVNTVENFPQFLEFIEWLKKDYRNISIDQNTNHTTIKLIVIDFCQELDYDNVQHFSGEVMNWLSPSWRKKFHDKLRLLQLEDCLRMKDMNAINQTLSKFIERYETIHFHSIFLFGQNNNLSAFIKHHGRDLDYLTDEYMDIYYSVDDTKKHNVTAYQRRKQFRNLDIKISHIPAFIIWKDSLTNSQVISLEGLSHQQIFDVIKHITSGIEQKKSLDEVSKIGKDQVESYLNHVTVINYNVKQAGAVGSNAIASDTVFNQLFKKIDNEEDL